MKAYLLDTNVLIDLASLKKSASFFEKLLSDGEVALMTSVICVAEYFAGAKKNDEKFLRQWIDSGELQVVGIDSSDEAYQAGVLRKKGALSLPDALILVTARRMRACLLTQDQEFLKKAKSLVAALSPF